MQAMQPLVSWYFEPSQLHKVISELTKHNAGRLLSTHGA